MFDLTVAPREVFLFPDGFISFEPTSEVSKRPVTVKAKYFYGNEGEGTEAPSQTSVLGGRKHHGFDKSKARACA